MHPREGSVNVKEDLKEGQFKKNQKQAPKKKH